MGSSSCWVERKECVLWVERYLDDCVCDLRSGVSFFLGMSSLFFWGIAELPQIVTNFRNKSGHGVSAALLLTWFIGDIFNLIGCRLEPATLPTQFYTALLYTTVTVVLLLQTFYYYYYIKHSKDNGFMNYASADGNDNGVGKVIGEEWTPSYLQTTYLGRVGSGPSAIPYMSSDEDDDDGNNTNIKPKFTSIYQAAGYSTVVLGSAGLPARASAFEEAQIPFQARRLFKRIASKDGSEDEGSTEAKNKVII
ncbi:hypothetical protein HPP92_003667 [Vanilla planifolia]|uniref:PQ-loop repeat family protein / transmembrane family protein n=1 Tax=Vanilla planifolia TaxID=51239 RepID=A0A835S2T0_VANPL|nr:hypothetical protein HPP92_003667 [Vanilla planifolia]